ncbi:MAG TPA: hypothetical protein VKT82_11335 [Ktedonobacterales bacterium]|nr:hypothetical protein [Ktedonobacterales bacterium]
MSIQPDNSGDRYSPYQTAEELFSHSVCTHIVSMPPIQDTQMGLHSQHVHLERQARAFRAIYHVDLSNLRTEDYPSLQDLYRRHPRWRDALWQDISAYPDLPYNTRYRPLTNTIEVWAMPDSDADSDQGSYIAYGSAEVVSLSPAFRKQLQPQDNWLIVRHPGRTWRVVSKKLILKSRGKAGNQSSQTKREPDFLIVYGQPPINWRDAEQHILSIETGTLEEK